jgi:hypothetical protein
MNESIKMENAVKPKRPIPQEISARVGQEILKANFEPGVWARAMAKAQGDQETAISEYARLRISQLMRAQTEARGKTDALEQRRLNACLGVKTVKDILNGIGKVGVVNIPRPRVPWIWMLLLVLGVAGCCASLTRMIMGEIPDALRLLVPIFSLGCGVAVVLLMIFSSQLFSRAFVAWAWGPGIVGLSSVVCIGSLLLGTKLMMDNPFVQPPSTGVSGQISDNSGETAYWSPEGISAPQSIMTRVAVAD